MTANRTPLSAIIPIEPLGIVQFIFFILRASPRKTTISKVLEVTMLIAALPASYAYRDTTAAEANKIPATRALARPCRSPLFCLVIALSQSKLSHFRVRLA